MDIEREKFCVTRKKKLVTSRDELLQMTKEELVEQVLRLEAHNNQLRNIISKGVSSEISPDRPQGRPFDFSKSHTRRVLLRISYQGWDWLGLATQEDTRRTIEHELFAALTRTRLVESREKCGYHRCGRTDKGVSSFGQVISISLRSKFPPGEQDAEENMSNELPYCKMLNKLLPVDIRALCWLPLPRDRPEFSARFDCTGRHYRYYFPRGNLDLAAMTEACLSLVGSHDFRNLCKMDVGNGVTQFVRNVRSCEITPVDGDSDDAWAMYRLRISGNAFLWHQIRCIMGVLLLVGQRRETAGVVRELLQVKEHPRKPQYHMALDAPLNLFRCDYELDYWRWDREELRTVVRQMQAEWTMYSVKKPQYRMALDAPLNLFRCDYELDGWRWDREELRTVVRQMQAEWTMYSVKATMIKDCVGALEAQLRTLEGESCEPIRDQAECLLQGVRSKTYKPLMERDMCSSLEEKIDHYTKRRRIAPVVCEVK